MPRKKKTTTTTSVQAHAPIDWHTVCELTQTMNILINGNEIETFDCGDLGCFVWNKGTNEERTEVLLAMLPVVTRMAKRLK